MIVDKRIQELVQFVVNAGPEAQQEPETDIWEQPEACVPMHPLVETFLRSSQQSMIYANFSNIGHARSWSRKHFAYGPNSRLARITLGGKGPQAYCRIDKIPRRTTNPAKQVTKLMSKSLKTLALNFAFATLI